VDELVLGCTHYPFLRPLIAEAAGPGIEIIDPAPAVARQTARVLANNTWLTTGPGAAEHAFFTTGDAGRFAAALSELLRFPYTARQATWRAGSLQ
jgi:glutamate racemase